MPEIESLSLRGLGQAVRQGRLTFAAILEHCLAREEASRGLNAFVELFASEALARADAQQILLDTGYDLGPLHGLPLGLKANIAIAGRRMTAGSRILAEHVADADAVVTRRLKQAGANLIGVTNMHEFAWGGTTANPHFGACRNPWDSERIPAGSSGGSGAAVAAGSALATLGTDTGGSIRLPAAMNGVTGLRPGVGRISCEGIFPLALTMDTVGPLARSAEDCALVFAVLAGLDQDRMAAALERPLSGLRIGLIEDYATERLQPDVEAAFAACLIAFEHQGATVRPLRLDGLAVGVDAQVIVDACEPSALHDDWLASAPDLYGEDVRVLLQAGQAFTAVEYLQAQRYRTYLRQQFDAAFANLDVIATPTLPFTAPRIGEERIVIGGREESTLTGNMRFTCLPSLAALPALSLPIGFDRDGLPIGAQLMGAADSECALLGIAHQFQQVTIHHRMSPPACMSAPAPFSERPACPNAPLV